MSRVTISVKDEVYNEISSLQDYYSVSSISKLVELSIDLLQWLKERDEEECTILSLAKSNNKLFVQNLPIKKLRFKTEDLKNLLEQNF